jgi:hypothetical protein
MTVRFSGERDPSTGNQVRDCWTSRDVNFSHDSIALRFETYIMSQTKAVHVNIQAISPASKAVAGTRISYSVKVLDGALRHTG